MQTPPAPGMPGFRVSDEPKAGFKELKFDSVGVPKTVELISDPLRPQLVVVRVSLDTRGIRLD